MTPPPSASPPLAVRPDPEALARRLLDWYDRHRRHLPWRMPPGVPSDPYRVWVSEVMLQQVRVETVARHYAPFLDRWPTVEALAATPVEEMLRAWSGLGRYARAHNLHACARLLVERHGGRLPEDEAVLRALPGIGPYTAAAIRAIAFGRGGALPPVDGNVERVVARLFALGWEPGTPAARRRAELREGAASLAPAAARPGDHAQAIMDLGATVCVPRRPRCGVCPLADVCATRALGAENTLVLGPRRTPKPKRFAAAFWVARPEDGAVLLRRRPAKGVLGGTLELPSTEWRPRRAWRAVEAAAPGAAPFPADWRRLPGVVRHALSSFEVEFVVLAAVGPVCPPEGGGIWVRSEDLGGEALSSLARKIIGHASAGAGDGRVGKKARPLRVTGNRGAEGGDAPNRKPTSRRGGATSENRRAGIGLSAPRSLPGGGHLVARTGLRGAAALGEEDEPPGRSRDTDRQEDKSEQLKAGHGLSHPRTLRPARCSTTAAPIHSTAPSITVLGASRDGPKS